MRSGAPRFEAGKFAGTKALRIEEGATNLLTANQSNVETDTTGFTAVNGATISRDTSEQYEGAASLKIVTNTSASAGMFVSVTTSAQGTYTSRCRVKNTGADMNVWTRINYSDATFDDSTHTVVASSGSFTDVVIAPLTSNGAKTVSSVQLHVRRTTGTANVTCYVDALQLAAKAYATTWHVGGATRNAEACAAPADLFDPAAGTIEVWIYLESIGVNQIIIDARQPGETFGNTNRLLLRIENGTLIFYYWNGASMRALNGGAVSAGVWTHVAATWSSAGGAVYRNGASQATHGDAPSLTAPPRLGIGARLDNTQQLNGLLGGLRITTGRARSPAEILAAFNANAQFTEDGPDATVFTFDGTMRALLPSNRIQFAPESSFLIPTSVTATTSAANYPATNSIDYEFPLLPHRTTNLNQTTLTFDFGDVVNFRAIAVAFVNWEGFQLATSYDGVTYTNLAGSPFAALKDETDQFRKWGQAVVASGRYARIIIPAQLPDENAGYFETPLVIFADDLNALEVNPAWGAQVGLGYNYESAAAGGHDEPQALGKQYLTLQVRGEIEREKSNDWLQLSALGNHQKFLLLQNFGKSQEAYLMRTDGRATWEEQSGFNAFSLSFREHIN